MHDDHGIVTIVEVLYLVIFCLAALVFIGFAGRLHAAGIEVANTSQTAARAASLAPNSAAAVSAAQQAVDESSLAARCSGGPTATVSWAPSPVGTWQGGSVSVRVTCTVANTSLTGVWAPGSRTIAASDSQPVDRYTR